MNPILTTKKEFQSLDKIEVLWKVVRHVFNQKMKQEYLNGKLYTKKGNQNQAIGKVVKIDWSLLDKEKFISELEQHEKEWIVDNTEFIVTDIFNWGLGSKVTLDHRFTVNAFKVYDIKTNEYVYKFPEINGDGIYKGK